MRPLPVDTLERSCGPDVNVIETGPDLEHTQGVPNDSCANPPQLRLSRGRGEGRVCRISLACRSAVTRSQSIPFTSRSAETPPHLERSRRDEISSSLSSQGCGGRGKNWFRRPPKRDMQGQAMTPEVRGGVSLSLSRRGNTLACQIDQRVCQVNATLANGTEEPSA